MLTLHIAVKKQKNRCGPGRCSSGCPVLCATTPPAELAGRWSRQGSCPRSQSLFASKGSCLPPAPSIPSQNGSKRSLEESLLASLPAGGLPQPALHAAPRCPRQGRSPAAPLTLWRWCRRLPRSSEAEKSCFCVQRKLYRRFAAPGGRRVQIEVPKKRGLRAVATAK